MSHRDANRCPHGCELEHRTHDRWTAPLWRAATFYLGCAILLAGCHAPPEWDDAPSALQELPKEVEIQPLHSDSVRLFLNLPQEVRAGEPVPISLHVENTTDRTLDLYLRGREIAFDLVVFDADGGVVWRRLEDEIIPAILRIEPLPAGESLDFADTWDQRTNAGDPVWPCVYTVHGELLTEADPLVTPPAKLKIEPD